MPFASRLLLLAACLLLVTCAPQPLAITREPTHLRLVTADSCGPLAEELAAAYEESHPWATVEVVGVFDSALAERTLREGNADLALLSWIEQPGADTLWSSPFARDGIAIIAHPDLPLEEIGLALLQEVYRGRVQEWEGLVLVVVSREEGSGTRAAFESMVLGSIATTPTAAVESSSDAVVEYVAHTPGAIGYVSTLRLGEGVRVLPVEGVLPAPATIADGSYPLWRPLYMASVGEPTGEAREFAQWVLGPDGQRIAQGR
jgi:phosphate transport system substrate-binding protein